MTLKGKTARTVQGSPYLATKKALFGFERVFAVRPHLLCVRMCLRIRVNLSEIPDELREKRSCKTVKEREEKARKKKKKSSRLC